MHSLPLFLRLNGRPVILLGYGDAAAAKRRLLDRAGAQIETSPDANAALAVIALDGDAADAAVAALRARGILVNAVDRPELCDFTFPAIVDRDPVLIAIGTGGASAGMAKALRLRIEAMLPERLGGLAVALGAARTALRARFPDARARRAALDAAFTPGGALDPLSDHAPDAVGRWLAATTDEAPAHRQMSIALTSADPDDLTLRTARLLGQADTVRHATDVPPAILARARADARLVALDLPFVAPPQGLTVVLEMAR